MNLASSRFHESLAALATWLSRHPSSFASATKKPAEAGFDSEKGSETYSMPRAWSCFSTTAAGSGK